MKRLLALCLSLGLLCALMTPAAHAAEVSGSASSIGLTYELSMNEAGAQGVSQGDIVEITFSMLRTDGEGSYDLGVFQNEIVYDQSFFRYVEGSAKSADGHSFDVIFDTRTTDDNIIKATAINGRGYEADMEVCTFQLEVIGTSGSGWVSSSRAMAYDANWNPIAINPAGLTVTIGSGSEPDEPPAPTHADHTVSAAWTSNADGHWHACNEADCTEVNDRAAHTAGEWVTTVAATATTEGTRIRSCSVCGYVMSTETIPATGTTTPTTPTTPDVTPVTMPNFTPGGTGGTTTPPTTIPDNPTPLDPGTTTITDDDTPLAGIMFEDVLPSAWYYDAVRYAFGKDLMKGVSDTRFAPDMSTERGMIVTILHRLEGTPAAAVSTFEDVAAGQWYTDAVNWGAANGVVTGYTAEVFRPTQTITREQLAAILYRYAQLKGYDTTKRADLSGYTDSEKISAYAVEAMQWTVAEGLISGVTSTTLVPRGMASRAQVAIILMRFCENIIPA